MSTVSVHIVTYNSADFVEDCLVAVFNQSYPIEAIIVIDNNSTDQTKEKLKSYLNKITFVGNKVNAGFAGAHNQAIRLSQCDYYLILNPDVNLHPDYVINLIKQFERDSSLGSATGKLLFKHSTANIDSTGIIVTKARRAFDRGAGDESMVWQLNDDVFGVSGAAAIYSKRMVDNISIDGCFFDEDFFAYKEDVDVAWRSRLMGWTACYCADAIAYHDRGWKKGSRKTIPLFIRKQSYINRYKMMLKNDSIKYMIFHFFPLVLYEIMSLIYFLFKEPMVLTAWFDLDISQLLKKRKAIQQARKVDFSVIYTYFK